MAHRVTYRLAGLNSESGSDALQLRLSRLGGVRIERVLIGLLDAPGELAVMVDGRRTSESELRAAIAQEGLDIS